MFRFLSQWCLADCDRYPTDCDLFRYLADFDLFRCLLNTLCFRRCLTKRKRISFMFPGLIRVNTDPKSFVEGYTWILSLMYMLTASWWMSRNSLIFWFNRLWLLYVMLLVCGSSRRRPVEPTELSAVLFSFFEDSGKTILAKQTYQARKQLLL